MKLKLNVLIVISFLGLARSLPAANPEKHEHHHHAEAAQGAALTIQGEVLDMACYMAGEEKGPRHKSCAIKCIEGGSPAGLLGQDGSVYLLVEDHGAPQGFADAKKLAGEQVKISGEVYHRGGVQALIVKSAVKAK